MHTPRVSDRGAAAVELALVLPVVLLLIFGVIDFGRLFNAQATLNGGVREGARVEALGTGDAVCATAIAAGFPAAGSPCRPDPKKLAVVASACTSPAAGDSYAVVSATEPFHFETGLSAILGFIGGGSLADSVLTASATFRCN